MKTRYVLFVLALLIACWVNGKQINDSIKPRVYLVSNAHLDTQWNWDIQTTIKEYVWNTINQNLFLLKKYPNYIFNFEGGVKYAWMKEYYPLQYEELKKYVKSGRWHISGSSWDATDALIPSVESAIRNIMYGQDFYRQEFGVESTDIFLPDCFGFGWTLPTVAAHCGLIGFSSQKLQWRHNPFYGDSKIPFPIGLWKGIDGATILMAHGSDYNTRWKDEDLSKNEDLKKLLQQSPLRKIYRYYGVGDRGGSPTIESVRAMEKGVNGNGPLEIVSASSDQLFKDYLLYDEHSELPMFNGELLMDVHGTGCYTSQAAMKLYNRQNELLGDAAERASVVAEWLNQASYPRNLLSEVWRRVIFHQFHDDLTGTSIPRAYEFSWNDELLSLKQFSDVLVSSMAHTARLLDTQVKGLPVILYNASGFSVTDLVEMEIAWNNAPKRVSVYDSNNKEVASQLLSYKDGKVRLLVEAKVPATGYAVYDVRLSGKSVTKDCEQTSRHQLENSVYRMILNDYGDIISLYDKRNDKEMVKTGKAIRLALFSKNESTQWPAWEILKNTIDCSPVSITEDVQVRLVENGPLRKVICVDKRMGDSHFRQYIRMYEGCQADRIDFYNEIDWRLKDALLKAEFPLNVENQVATYDLGLGSIERGNNTNTAYEVYAHYWADLTDKNGAYGVSIMNDCKYGWDKPDDNTLRLSLLHTPGTDKRYSYQNQQDHGFHCFTYSLVGHAGQLDKAWVVEKAEILNQKIKAICVDKHSGVLGREFSFVASNNKNIVIKALKKAERSNEYIVRIYEIGGKKVEKGVLSFASDIAEVWEADGTEKATVKGNFEGSDLLVDIKPFSIKTFKVRLVDSGQEDKRSQFAYLPLAYNSKCTTYNEFRSDADFDSGYSYAAELFPDSLQVDQVPFALGEKDACNGLRCDGDTIYFPKGNKYNRVYILAAASKNDTVATFVCGKNRVSFDIPYYTGFIGQWGHVGHTSGYLKKAQVAYVGTHRHSPKCDEPYEFTYMFKFSIDIPKGATYLVLPRNKNVVLFAATLACEKSKLPESVTDLYQIAITGK